MKKYIPALLLMVLVVPVYSGSKHVADLFKNRSNVQAVLFRYSAKYYTDMGSYMSGLTGEPATMQGSVYDIAQDRALRCVRELLSAKNGYYAFRIEQNFGIGGKKDRIAIINNTEDQLELIRLTRISGNDFEISNEEIVKWFKKWDNEFDFRITGAGVDFIEADIIKEPADYRKLAEEIYSMCPDVVDQGTDTVDALADEMKKNKSMYFWWD